VLSREEIDRMEAAAPVERDKIIVRLFGDCGLRLGELVGLRTKDIIRTGNQAYLRVYGKGDRERRVPVAPKLLRRAERYMAGRPAETQADRMFISLRRGPLADYEALTESGVCPS
jgi:integrase